MADPKRLAIISAILGSVVEMADRAMLHGKGHDVWEIVVENIP